MADQEKKVEVRFGAFSCSIEGYDDPVAQMRDVLAMMQKMIAETPALAHATQDFDAEPIAHALGARPDETAPGVVVIRNERAGPADAEVEDAAEMPEQAAAPEPEPAAGAAVAGTAAPAAARAPWTTPEIAEEHLAEPSAEAGPEDAGTEDPEDDFRHGAADDYEDDAEDDDGGGVATRRAVGHGPSVGVAPATAARPVPPRPAQAPPLGAAFVNIFADPDDVEAPDGPDVQDRPDIRAPAAAAARRDAIATAVHAGGAMAADVSSGAASWLDGTAGDLDRDDVPDAGTTDEDLTGGEAAARYAPDRGHAERSLSGRDDPARDDGVPGAGAAADRAGPEATAEWSGSIFAPPPEEDTDFIPEPAASAAAGPGPAPAEETSAQGPAVREEPAPGFDAPVSDPPGFDAPDFGAPDFAAPDFAAPDFDASDFAAPESGTPDFGTRDFGAQDLAPPDALPQVEEAPEPQPPMMGAPGEAGSAEYGTSGDGPGAHGTGHNDEPPGPAAIAARSGDGSTAGLLGASAAWLTLVRGSSRFTRREAMDVLETIPSEVPRDLADRIKGFGRLVRSGAIVLVDDGVFAMSQAERERYEALLSRD